MSLIYFLWSFTFQCIFIVYAEFLMFSLFFYLYIVRNDDNKDDQSINNAGREEILCCLVEIKPLVQ